MSEQIERIGKVRLDLSNYGGRDLYCDGAVEDELLSIAMENDPEEFPQIIAERLSWPVLYHLSDLRENIVSWLRLPEGAKVLEVGSGCGAISGALSKAADRLDCVELSLKRSRINAWRHKDAENICIHVGNFEDIEPGLDTDYDALFLIGVFEYAASYIHDEDPYGSFLRIVRRHVKQGGRVIIAIENRLGMKYFGGAREDHLGEYFTGIEDYPRGGVVRTFSRPALEQLFEREGVPEYHFYYPYPDYKFMMNLYSDRRLPQEGELCTNRLRLDRDRMELFDEGLAYDSVIRDGLFPVFSNSYLVVLGPAPETVYSKYSNDRAAEYAIRTDILEKQGARCVEKYPMTAAAKEHIRGIMTAAELLKKRYEGSSLSVCEAELTEDGDGVRFPFLEGETMEKTLESALRRRDREAAAALLKEYRDFVFYGAESGADNPDMQLANLMGYPGCWQLIDYEWTQARSGDPMENLIRGLYLFREYNSCGMLLTTKLIARIVPEAPTHWDMAELWRKERVFQKQVTGSRLALGELNERLGNAVQKPTEPVKDETEELPPEILNEPRKNALKQTAQQLLAKRALRAYEKELAFQSGTGSALPAGGMIAEKRREKRRFSIVPYSLACAEDLRGTGEFILFAEDGGFIAEDAFSAIERYFDEHKDCLWLYTDEDEQDASGICAFPYHKPCWSPETLLSQFYIGGMFALRRSAAEALAAEPREEKGFDLIYALCLRLGDMGEPALLGEICFHRTPAAGSRPVGKMLISGAQGGGAEYTAIKRAYLTEHSVEAYFETDPDGLEYPVYKPAEEGAVSIVIPSKDHPELLKSCVASIRKYYDEEKAEILVIDNGSNSLCRGRYERLAEEYAFRYLYRPMNFNFSAMCDLGAKETAGTRLLFLNDDTEMISADALERMAGQLDRGGVGAVGAKLYYRAEDVPPPDCGPKGKEHRTSNRRIQHCGVSIAGGRPMHRLQGWDDGVSYDRGRNRGVRNVLAVTGACLMIKRSLFEELGGFCEELPVAYNDVDLCLRLAAKGYRSVIRNDVRFFHRESYSRGDDRADAEKLKRLKQALKLLWERNPAYRGTDPYDSLRLSAMSERYEAAYPYEDALLPVNDALKVGDTDPRQQAVNETLVVQTDRFEKDFSGESYLLDLHAHILWQDNALFRYRAYLTSPAGVWELPVIRRYRPDSERILEGIVHAELSGLALRFDAKALPAGEYELWVEAKSQISRQRLFRKADEPVLIGV